MIQPRPQDDEAIAKISAWLQENKFTGHVDRKGRTTIRDKTTGQVIWTSAS